MDVEHKSKDGRSRDPGDQQPAKKRNFFCNLSSLQASLVFAFISITGQVGQNISLPLWLSASKPNHGARMDAYFVIFFSCVFFVVAFGLMYLIMRVFYPYVYGQAERQFPHKLLLAVGFCDALNGLLVVFASPPDRTAPYLQAILGNFMIPLTIVTRYILLKKKPTFRKFICGMLVMLSLFVCLLPSIFPKQLDPHKKKEPAQGATGVAGILWPLCFMIGFAPATLLNVLSEKGLKMQMSSRNGVNIVYFLFWESFYQLLSVVLFFWVDILPGYGFTSNLNEFGGNWLFGFRCFFGGEGCGSTPGIRGTVFVMMYLVAYLGGALFLRYTEGATLVAIANCLVTPLGFLFWTLFTPEPFAFKPDVQVTTYYSIGALVVMVPAIYFYNTGAPETDMTEAGRQEYHVEEPWRPPTETDPLINKNTA